MSDFISNEHLGLNRKVLLITYDFYPDSSPNTYRWLNIVKKWREQGVQVFVVSANKNQFPSYEEVDGIKIYRTGEYAIGNLKYSFNKNNHTNAALIQNEPGINLKKIAKTLFRKLYDITWSKLYWPDYAFLWKYTALPVASKLIKDENIDKIITVSWMFTAHTIGYELKKTFKNVFWLADTVDPFSFNSKINNTPLYGKLNALIEKKIFLGADLNSVLTERIKSEYILKFPEISKKVVVGNNLFVPVNFDYTNNIDAENVVKMVFLGTLSEDTRSPKNLLILFDKLVSKYTKITFELSFFGELTDSMPTFSKYDSLLNKSVFLNGRISRDEVNTVIKNADVLVNIGNNNKYQEPSKVIEYMYSGKKILNVCIINEDTSASLLSKYPLHLNVFPDDLDSDLILQSVFNFIIKKENVQKKVLKEVLNDYLLDTVADKYYDYIFVGK
jgi:glycosyltransferase involved in cell wall biosynthesis